MMRLAWLTAGAALVPAPAAACAVCLTSAYGDRSFNWAFVGLMLMPFVVAGGLSLVLLVLSRGFGGRQAPKPERQVARC